MARRMLKRKAHTQPKWEQVHHWLREAAGSENTATIADALARAQAAAKKWPNPRSRAQTALGPNLVRAIDDINALGDPAEVRSGAKALAAWVARESRVRAVARAQALGRRRLTETDRRRNPGKYVNLQDRLVSAALAAVAGRLRHA